MALKKRAVLEKDPNKKIRKTILIEPTTLDMFRVLMWGYEEDAIEQQRPSTFTEGDTLRVIIANAFVEYCVNYGVIPEVVLSRAAYGVKDPVKLFDPTTKTKIIDLPKNLVKLFAVCEQRIIPQALMATPPVSPAFVATEPALKPEEPEKTKSSDNTREVPHEEISDDLNACVEPPKEEEPEDGLIPGMMYTFPDGTERQLLREDIEDIRAERRNHE